MKWTSRCNEKINLQGLGSFWNIKDDSYKTYIRAFHSSGKILIKKVLYQNILYIHGKTLNK
jgi:hypothetical protein